MPKLPVLSGKELIRILIRLGFEEIRQKGSHVSLSKKKDDGGLLKTVVPLHKELAKGTLRDILNQCEVSKEELIKNS